MQCRNSNQIVRPCGPYDRRRTGHRCTRCRLDHIACDGQRPCAGCLQKQVVCQSPSSSCCDMTVLSYWPAKNLGAVRKPLVDISSLYTTLFFEAVNPRTQPLIDTLSFDSIGHLFHNDELVHNAVVALGATYASRKQVDAGPIQDPDCRHLRDQIYTDFRTKTLRKLLTTNSHTSTSIFVSALLLSIAELITDKFGIRWRYLLHQIYIYIVRPRGPYGFPGSFETALLTFFRHLDVLRAAMFSEDVSLGDEWWHIFEFRRLAAYDGRNPDDTNWAEHILEFAERWASLRFRSLQWLERIEDSLTIRGEHYLHLGEEIVQEAVILEKRIINHVPLVMARRYGGSGNTPMSIMSYYYWGLVGLSRMFVDPRWQLLRQRFHMMDECAIHQCAMAALTCVESRVNEVKLEAMLYAPTLRLIALEARTLEERNRIIHSLRGVRSKGFPVADTIESDMRFAWASVAGSLSN